MKNSGRRNNTGDRACRRGNLRKWLAGFLAASTAFTMLSGSAATLMAEEPGTEYALAGAGSGEDVTVHFGNGEDQDISIHVNKPAEETDGGIDTGVQAVDAGELVTISTVDGSDLPQEAEASGEVLTGKKEEAAVEKVEAVADAESEGAGASSDANSTAKENVSLAGAESSTEKTATSSSGAGSVQETEAPTVEQTEYQVFDISLDNVNEKQYKEGFKVEVNLPEEVTGKDFRLYHIHEGQEPVDITESLNLVSTIDEETGMEVVSGFEFVTKKFSEFVLKYTVDFTYVDEEGNEHFWQFPGTGSHKIKEVLNELGIEFKTVENVENPVLVEAVEETLETALYVTRDEEGEWWINSDEAFDDTYELTVTADGKEHVITVTDAQGYKAAVLHVEDYNGHAAALNWTTSNRYLWWIARATINGTVYSASQCINTNSSDTSYEWNLSALAKNGNINDWNNNNRIELPISGADVDIFLVSYKDQNNTPYSNNVLNSEAIQLTGENSNYGGYTYLIEKDDNGVTHITAKENQPYVVDVYFKNKDDGPASVPTTNGNLYVYASINAENKKDNKISTYHCVTKVTLDSNGHDEIPISSFYRGNNANPSSYSYSPDMKVTIKLVQNGNEYFVGDAENNRGQITGGTIISDGAIVDGFAYTFTTDSESHKTSIVAKQPHPYNYTVEAFDKNGTAENINFDGNSGSEWYLLGETTRSDGTYYYTHLIPNNKGTTFEETVNKMYRKGADNATLETVPTDNDLLTFSLIRPKDSSKVTWEDLSDPDNVNVKALSGSSVGNRYTVTMTSSANQATITLKQGPDAGISVNAYQNDGKTPENDISLSGDHYFIVGDLAFRDGLVGNDKNCYFVQKLSAGSTAAIVNGFESFNNNSTETQFLTGTRSFEPILVYANDGNKSAEDILSALKNRQMDGLTIYRNGSAVECYRMTSENGDLEHPTAKIKLTRLPQLEMQAEVKTSAGSAASAIDKTKNYYILAEIVRDGEKSYAYLPLTQVTQTGKLDQEFKTAEGVSRYYREEDRVNFYIVQSDVSADSITLETLLGGHRYAAGQLIPYGTGSNYTPDFSFNRETSTVSVTLTETTVPMGSSYTVAVEMLDKTQASFAPAESLNEDYRVLAELTVKEGVNKGQVVGWTLLDVDDSNLKSDGHWSGSIAGDGFDAVDANMVPTGQEIGYNADAYGIKMRMFHANSWAENMTYEQIRAQSDAAPSGYDFKGVFTKDEPDSKLPETVAEGIMKVIPENTSVIRLHSAYEKDYGIRVYVDQEGLDIPEGEYIVRVVLHHKGGNAGNPYDTYAFARLVINENAGVSSPVELQFYDSGDDDHRIWRYHTGGGKLIDDANNPDSKITGNELGVDLQILQLINNTDSNFSEWVKTPLESSICQMLSLGESINMYTFTQGDREEEEDLGSEKIHLYDVLRFTKDMDGITKGTIDGYLENATNFGLYTITLSKHATDMESNIGAAHLTGEIGADYGFSGNNFQVNRVKVTKRYTDGNGKALKDQPITLRLYPVDDSGNIIGSAISPSTKNPKTDKNGTVEVIFDKLVAGKYKLAEVINNQEFFFDSPYNSGEGEEGNFRAQGTDVYVKFSEKYIEIEDININYNYFGDISENVTPYPVLRYSRHGLVVTADANDYNNLVDANNGTEPGLASVRHAGVDAGCPVLDIEADIHNLKNLSTLLADSGNSQTVRIINTTLERINATNGLNLKGDGRYIVVNIDMSQAGSNATVNLETVLNGQRLMADFGGSGNEDSSKVLFNFITRDAYGKARPYTGKINTATQAAGVLLAPDAIVADLGGNFGGTIVCREAQHTGSEIHSDSQNKIQNKNTVLTNSKARIETGDLELKKAIEGSSDRTTWFTFEITLEDKDGNPINYRTLDADNNPLTNTFPASGLPSGNSVTFDSNGVAYVKVRAQERVLITGIPKDIRYTIREIETPESEHYELKNIEVDQGNVGSGLAAGVIVQNKASKVKFTNKKKTGGLEVTKTVESPVAADKEQKFNFTIEIKLPKADVPSEGGPVIYSEIVFNRVAGSEDTYSAAFQLADGDRQLFSGLPEGTKYTITETPNSAFVITPEGGTISGEIKGSVNIASFTNTLVKTTFSFTKQWRDSSSPEDQSWPQQDKVGGVAGEKEYIPITVHLNRKLNAGTDGFVEDTSFNRDTANTYVISPSSLNGWTMNDASNPPYVFTKTGLQKVGSITVPSMDEEDSKTYNGEFIYYLTEDQVTGYKAPVYLERVEGEIEDTTSNSRTSITNNGAIRNTFLVLYDLPATGGEGTRRLILMGILLIALAGAGLIMIRCRREMTR